MNFFGSPDESVGLRESSVTEFSRVFRDLMEFDKIL